MNKCVCVGMIIGAIAGAVLYKKCNRFKQIIDKGDSFFCSLGDKAKDMVADSAHDMKDKIQDAVCSDYCSHS